MNLAADNATQAARKVEPVITTNQSYLPPPNTAPAAVLRWV